MRDPPPPKGRVRVGRGVRVALPAGGGDPRAGQARARRPPAPPADPVGRHGAVAPGAPRAARRARPSRAARRSPARAPGIGGGSHASGGRCPPGATGVGSSPARRPSGA